MAKESRHQGAPYLVGLDLETTGLKLEAGDGEYFDEILEVSAVGFQLTNLKKVHETTWLICPSELKKITARSQKINGIGVEDVRHKPQFHQVAEEIHRALHGNIWFGHNIKAFDQRALGMAFRRVGLEVPQPAYIIDTLHVFPRYFQKDLPNKKLATFMSYFELGQQSHRALDDVNDLFQVFQRIAMIRFLEHIIPVEFLRPGPVPELPSQAALAPPVAATARVVVEEHVATSVTAAGGAQEVAVGDVRVAMVAELSLPSSEPSTCSSSAGQSQPIDQFQLNTTPEEIAERLELALSLEEGPRGGEGGGVTGGMAEVAATAGEVAAPSATELETSLTVRSGRPSLMVTMKGQEFVWEVQRAIITSTVRDGGPYNTDSSGRPDFRILVRLPPPAADFVHDVSRLVESALRQSDQPSVSTPWESPLLPSRGAPPAPPGCSAPCHTIRLKIRIEGGGTATLAYATRFATTPGASHLASSAYPPRAVTVAAFSEALPNDSTISARVRFESYSFTGQRSGLRLVAEEITKL